MGSNAKRDCAILAAITILTRFATRSHVLYDIDSVNFALALDHFDPSAHQPHPPGYYLYVLAGRAVRLLTGDSNDALVAISIAASAGLAILVYLLTRDWFDRRAALLAGALFVLSPLSWFHGTVALTYIVEAFFSALVGWFCWRTARGAPRAALWAAIVLGLAGGFRPSIVLFLLPLWLYSTRRLPLSSRLYGVAALVSAASAWFLPMLVESGGPAVYFGALWDLWRIVPGAASEPSSWLALSLARLVTVLFIVALSCGLPGVLLLLKTSARSIQSQRAFILWWITPPLLFFTLVFLKFVNSGYLLLITPPLFALMGNRAAAYTRYTSNRWLTSVGAGSFAAANVAVYLFAPLYCSFGEVRRFEHDLAAACAQVRATASPTRSILVGFDSHFLGYRHAAYYLPEFTVLQYPEVKYVSGTRLFSVAKQRTSVLRTLDLHGFESVAFFPLTDSAHDQAFVRRSLAVLPPGSVSNTGGHPRIITTSISALPKLFPLTVPPALSTAVYTRP